MNKRKDSKSISPALAVFAFAITFLMMGYLVAKIETRIQTKPLLQEVKEAYLVNRPDSQKCIEEVKTQLITRAKVGITETVIVPGLENSCDEQLEMLKDYLQVQGFKARIKPSAISPNPALYVSFE